MYIHISTHTLQTDTRMKAHIHMHMSTPLSPCTSARICTHIECAHVHIYVHNTWMHNRCTYTCTPVHMHTVIKCICAYMQMHTCSCTRGGCTRGESKTTVIFPLLHSVSSFTAQAYLLECVVEDLNKLLCPFITWWDTSAPLDAPESVVECSTYKGSILDVSKQLLWMIINSCIFHLVYSIFHLSYIFFICIYISYFFLYFWILI